METVTVTRRDLLTLKKLGLKPRRDCLASFSVNENGEILMYVTRGYTKEEKRKYLSVQCLVVGKIAGLYLSERPEGGRFFLKRYVEGGEACYRLAVGSDVTFAQIEFP